MRIFSSNRLGIPGRFFHVFPLDEIGFLEYSK